MWGRKKTQNRISSREQVKIRKVFVDAWIVKLEKKAFGWTFTQTTEEQTGQDVQFTYMEHTDRYNCTVTPLHDKFYHFSRPQCYKHNLLFRLVEFLYRIAFFIRRWGIILIMMTIPFFALSIILTYAGCEFSSFLPFSYFKRFLPPLGIAYVVLLVAPAVISVVGFLLRKLFKLDKNADY